MFFLTTKQNPEMSNQGNFKCCLVFKAQAVLFSLLLIFFFFLNKGLPSSHPHTDTVHCQQCENVGP